METGTLRHGKLLHLFQIGKHWGFPEDACQHDMLSSPAPGMPYKALSLGRCCHADCKGAHSGLLAFHEDEKDWLC